jgi:hypothetical protein
MPDAVKTEEARAFSLFSPAFMPDAVKTEEAKHSKQ